MVRRIIDSSAAHSKVRLADLSEDGLWQHIVLGFALVGNDARYLAKLADTVIRNIEEDGEARLYDVQRDLQSFGQPRSVPVLEDLSGDMQ